MDVLLFLFLSTMAFKVLSKSSGAILEDAQSPISIPLVLIPTGRLDCNVPFLWI